MTVEIPTKNHAPLRQAMFGALTGADVTRSELLALAKRHGQTEELFDADFATMGKRLELHAAYWASPEGVAITEAREAHRIATENVEAAVVRFASDSELAHLRTIQVNAAAELNKLQNANSEQYQAFARAMKATAFPDGDYMDPTNVMIH